MEYEENQSILSILDSGENLVESAPCSPTPDISVEKNNNDCQTDTNLSRVRLSDAARKRYEVLIGQGIVPEEALRLCQHTFRRLKKMVSEQLQATQALRNKLDFTIAEEDIIMSTSWQYLGSSRVGICNRDPMTENQLLMVRKAILAAIISSPEADGTGPRFVTCIHKPDWLLIVCQDMVSQQWLEKIVPQLQPWPQADLSLISEPELSASVTCEVIIPKSEVRDPTEVIALIRAQNKGIHTNLWKIYNTRDDDAGMTLTLIMDVDSYEAIKRMELVQVGFIKVMFRKIKESYLEENPSKQLPATEISSQEIATDYADSASTSRLQVHQTHRGRVFKTSKRSVYRGNRGLPASRRHHPIRGRGKFEYQSGAKPSFTREQNQSYECLNKNNYDQEKCDKYFENYNTCKKFWGKVFSDRKAKGLQHPYMPEVEERDKIKQEYLAKIRFTS